MNKIQSDNVKKYEFAYKVVYYVSRYRFLSAVKERYRFFKRGLFIAAFQGRYRFSSVYSARYYPIGKYSISKTI